MTDSAILFPTPFAASGVEVTRNDGDTYAQIRKPCDPGETWLIFRDENGNIMSDPHAAELPLRLAGTYKRTVRASLDRVWENVFDWEHLPALHEQDFHEVQLLDSGPWGWRACLVNQPGDATRAQTLELRADKGARHYVVSTLDGPGKGSEVRTALTPRSTHRTEVNVAFLVPAGARDLSSIGSRYVEIYARLWDQDEAMMMRRERVLDRRRRSRGSVPKRKMLGRLAVLRARLPLLVPFGSETFRVIELDGEIIAHAVTCPHWLGPLEDTTVIDGCIRCPWHGYRFDVRSGKSADGHQLSLPRPPKIVIADGRVSLERAG